MRTTLQSRKKDFLLTFYLSEISSRDVFRCSKSSGKTKKKKSKKKITKFSKHLICKLSLQFLSGAVNS